MKRRLFGSGLFAGIVVLALSIISPAIAQAPIDPPGFAQAIAAQEANTDRLLAVQGVVGTAVGLDARGQAAVVIMTDDVGVRGLPRQLDGVSVIVKVTGPFRAVHHREGHISGPDGGGDDGGGDPAIDPTARFDRPVPIGVSSGNNNSCSAGTIGARVTKEGRVYALSNNHVYALENNANPEDPIAQPGRLDTGCTEVSGNEIGSLSEFVPLHFDGSDNTVDAAMALSSTSVLGNGTPPDGYGVPSWMTIAAFLGQPVQKYGRTTGPTSGVVAALNATVNVGYNSGTARFVGQIIVDGDKGGFLNAGDSGSLLVDQGSPAQPVGLLFASGRGGKIAIANPIDLVLEKFAVMIDGQ